MSNEPKSYGDNLFARLRGHKTTRESTGATPSSFLGKSPSAELRRDWTLTDWAKTSMLREFVSTVILWAVAVLVWGAYLTAPTHIPLELQAQRTLRESTKVWLAGERKQEFGGLNFFLRSTLSVYHELSPEGSPFRTLLSGIYAPKLLSQADEYYQNHKDQIRAIGLHQSFEMDPIDKELVLQDKKTGKLAISVSGTLVVFNDKNGKTTRIPYDRQFVISPNIPNPINPFDYYVEDIKKKQGGAK